MANGYHIGHSRVGFFHRHRKLSSGQHYSRELFNLDSLISADIAMHGGRIELKVSRPVETQLSHLSNVKMKSFSDQAGGLPMNIY